MSISGKYLKTAGLIWGISLVLFGMIFFLGIKPQLQRHRNLDNEIENLQAEYDKVKALTTPGVKEELKNEIEQMKAELAAFLVESKSDIQGLAFREIRGISEKLELEGFDIENNPGEISTFSDCKYVYGQPMQVSFNGSFKEFATFLNILERHKSVIFVDTFSINKSTEDQEKHKVEMTLAVLVKKDAFNKQS